MVVRSALAVSAAPEPTARRSRSIRARISAASGAAGASSARSGAAAAIRARAAKAAVFMSARAPVYHRRVRGATAPSGFARRGGVC